MGLKVGRDVAASASGNARSHNNGEEEPRQGEDDSSYSCRSAVTASSFEARRAGI